MKKFATMFLAAALSLSLLAVGASADFDGAIKKGTAKVDGVLDDAYNYSFSLKDLGTAANAYGTEWNNTAKADVYFLYDDTTLYICALVEDDDVLTKGETFAIGNNPYANDNIEFRLSLDGSPTDTIKVAVDAYGYACYGLVDHYDRIDYSSIAYATTYTETSYVVEVGIPCTKGELDMIKTGKLGFTYQLNDINAEGKHQNHTTSFQGEAVKMPVFVALSNEAATAGATTTPAAPSTGDTTTTPAAPSTGDTTTTPAAPSTGATTTPATPSTGATTAPSTFDPALIAVALTAASGAAFVFASKKH